MRNPERVGLALSCLVGAAVAVVSYNDGARISEEFSAKANLAFPSIYSPEDLGRNRRLVSQYDYALQTDHGLVAKMRSTGNIFQARIVVEDEKIRQSQIIQFKQELGREDSGLLGISKGWREVWARIGTGTGLALIGGTIAGWFLASRSKPQGDSLGNSGAPGVVIGRPIQ